MKRFLLLIVVSVLIIGAVIVVLPDFISDSEQLNRVQPLIIITLVVFNILGLISNLLQIRESELFGGFFKSQPKKSNEEILLDQVYNQWVKTYLYDTLGDSDTFDIQLDIKPHAVLRGQRFEKYKAELPDVSSQILELYKLAEKKLLILGEPGSGKTFLLIQLAEQLLKEARNDSREAMPVVLNLSSWTAQQFPFEEWLVDELKRQYGISKKLAQEWIRFERLIYLLDGLDEVVENQRLDCVKAINSFQEQYKNVAIVICSRVKEYEALSDALSLYGAIQLEPLTKTQIEAYITRDEYKGFWEYYDKDEKIQELAQIPFMLQSMAYSYHSLKAMQLDLDAGQSRIEHIFDSYLDNRRKQTPSSQYTPQKTGHYLSWLAHQLVKNDKTLFFIEDLQASWLEDKKNQQIYQLLLIVIVGVIVGVFVGLPVGVIGGVSLGVLGGALVGLLFGVIGSLGKIEISDNLSWHFSRNNLSFGMFAGLLVAVLFAIMVALMRDDIGLNMDLALLVAVLVAVLATMLSGLEISSNVQERQRANDGIRTSLKNGVLVAVRAGVLFGLFVGVLLGIIVSVSGSLSSGLSASVIWGLIFAGLIGPMVGMLFGWRAVIKHIILREILYHVGLAPRNYADFLDYAVSAGFMRRIGAAYAFRHDYLRQYFAGLYKPEEKS